VRTLLSKEYEPIRRKERKRGKGEGKRNRLANGKKNINSQIVVLGEFIHKKKPGGQGD